MGNVMNKHPRAPWGDITFVGVYWNCEDRVGNLLEYVRPWFKHVVVGVQDSPDNTLMVAKQYADLVVPDKWRGRGDPTIQKVLNKVRTKWVFLISDDEWPTESLLYSFQDLAESLVSHKKDGAWVHFVSTIDDINFTREQDEHLRLFETKIGWPSSQHARPMTSNTLRWRPDDEAYVRHDRSLDEMITDYVRRYKIGIKERASSQQMEHNRRMMRGACGAIADHKGWDYVKSFAWWPEVVEHAYGGKSPA